ncbi:MAG TPA: mechanosensitive ion channel family protein [Bryobacteraceae bacterium]|nr:mechanosensitive ion channel family protein [Bryobacteraceae bacterium]
MLLSALGSAWAQPTSNPAPQNSPQAASRAEDPLKRDSPQSCVAGFLQACRAHDYTRACSYLDLRSLPHTARLKEGRLLAQQLEQVLNRDTRFDVGDLSSDPKGSAAAGMPANRERVDSFNDNGQPVNLELERIRLRSGLWIWLFSSDTIARIPRLMRISSDSPIEKYLPDALVTWTLAGMALWQWIAFVLLALITAALAYFICPLAVRCTQPLLRRVAPHLDSTSLRLFIGPARLLLAAALFRLGMEWISPSPAVRLYLGRLLALLFTGGIFWLLLGIIDLGLVRIRSTLQARRHIVSYSALPLAARVFKILLLLLFIAALLTEWGYNTTTILASLGVGGIAIALAAQKTIENFFGGVSVVADRPVAVGDFCKFGDRMGTVEDIGLRSTRVRTPDRTLVTVPNGQFSTMTIENFSKRDKMLFHFLLNLRRDTEPDQVRSLLQSINSLLQHHNKVDAGTTPVHFVGVGTYSLDLNVFAYILTSDDGEFAQVREELLLAMLDAVKEAGTALALPTHASIEYSHPNQPQPNGTEPAGRAKPPAQQER